MNLTKLVLTTAVAGILANLTACSESGTDTAATDRVVTGPITSFGSIYVNGTPYNTDNSTIYIEDDVASESELRVGMMVSVETSTGDTATAVHFDDDLEGFVTSSTIAADNTGTMVIMGQNVSVTGNTVFESKVAGITSAADIIAGNIVEVSGYSAGEGDITATRLEVKAADLATYLLTHPEGVELKGFVAAHDTIALSFMIGSLPIDYSNAIVDDMPQGSWDGLYVEVKSTQELVIDTLIASEVELENDGTKDHIDDEDEIEVYGPISDVSDTSVTVNGHTFLLNDSTIYEHGTVADLAIDVMVEIEGHLNADNELVAHEIEFEGHDDDADELEGIISTIETTDINIGTITLTSGEIILVDNNTVMQDSRDDDVLPDTRFNLSDLGTGDYVEAYVIDNGDGTYTATKLEREDED